jgi:hypothetical protein
MTTTRLEKLRTNFKGELFDQYDIFPEPAVVTEESTKSTGHVVKITAALFGISNTKYFYKYSVIEKLATVERLKAIAGDFFKVGNLKKAAKVYQRINGWFNFGDASNNYLKEDAESEEFKVTNEKLLGMKIICFSNLTVCKFKMNEFVSVIGITD